MFAVATRTKLRFETSRGQLSIEQLWDVPLRPKGKDDFDLDTVARAVNKKVKEISEGSFVESTKNPEQARLELALGLVKHVIQIKLDEEDSAKIRKENKKKRDRLTEILAQKEDQKLGDLTAEEIKKQIAELR
jgi:hypothetical protein